MNSTLNLRENLLDFWNDFLGFYKYLHRHILRLSSFSSLRYDIMLLQLVFDYDKVWT